MSAENKPATSPDQETLVNALDTIKQVLVGKELESVRRKVAKLDSGTSSDIEAVKKEVSAAIAQVTSEMSSRIEELVSKLAAAEKAQAKALSKLEKDLSAREEALRGELGNLGQALSHLQLELQQQMETNERMSALLGNMATVFSGGPPPNLAEGAGEENLDSAIDRVFGDSEGDPGRN